MIADSQKDNTDDVKGKGFPQILHDRARDAGLRLHSLLVSLATGGLGIYFLALTAKVDPPLTSNQKAAVVVGLTAMATALGSGILNWYADCRRNFHWASALQATQKEQKSAHYGSRDRWQRVDRLTASFLGATFLVGIVASAGYICLRVFEL